jgi:hypothetical protein
MAIHPKSISCTGERFSYLFNNIESGLIRLNFEAIKRKQEKES